MDERRQLALKHIDLKGEGLELGPLYSPLVLKSDGKVSYVDHTSTENLKKKYQGEPFELNNLVEVDYALEDKSLAEVLRGKKFDYVVASHVIEHLPDMVSWLQDIAAVLKPNGVLSLVIPDKRFTFDITRNVSRPADIIGAYLDKRTKPSSAVMYDYTVEVRRDVVAHNVWQDVPGNDRLRPAIYTAEQAYQTAIDNLDPKQYVDCHCNVFTPYSFFEVLKALIQLDLFDYEIIGFQDTPENKLEFYITMRKSAAPAKKRLASIPKVKAPLELWELQSQLAEVRATLDRIRGSRSWKLSKPLRDLKAKLRR